MSEVAIVDYGLGNIASLAGAVEKLGHRPLVTADPHQLAAAPRLILPGVGAFGDGMRNLRERGLVEVLDRLVENGKKLLGICLGAQLMCRSSDEFGNHAGLGWFDAQVVRLNPGDARLRVPHVGWDDLHQVTDCPLFAGIPADALFYYVHSFRIRAADRSVVAGTCEYGERFDAVLSRGSLHAVQFHPEKSQQHGLTMLRNFLEGA